MANSEQRLLDSFPKNSVEELRAMLGLTTERYCSLLDIDKMIYIKWRSGEGQPSVNQKILLRKVYEAAIKRGIISDING